MKKDLPVMTLPSAKAWEQWLTENHSQAPGVWLRIFKKDSAMKTVTYAEALDEALCYGWIDGQKNKYDKESWLQKFTPRQTKSIWSKRNIEHCTRLMKTKKMKPAGLRAIEKAKKDGRWKLAYDSPSKMTVPEDFLKRLSKDKKAEAFYLALNRANIYAIAWRLQTAKNPETREKRMQIILEMMTEGKKFHG
jgi:uncharacterized protein YdeI (YjbR/CyaY-like superfamily)